jgi:hypothetical protein
VPFVEEPSPPGMEFVIQVFPSGIHAIGKSLKLPILKLFKVASVYKMDNTTW